MISSVDPLNSPPLDARAGGWSRHIQLALTTVARYVLALGMFPYAWSKLQDYQFQVPPSVYLQPLEQISGRMLTWAWLGFSPTFQILLGVLEGLSVLLLLWTRTKRLGALLMFPLLLNVVLVNFFYDLWPDTKIISSVLLALNLFLILYDFRIYLRILAALVASQTPPAKSRFRTAATVASIAVPILFIGSFIFYFHGLNVDESLISDFIGVRQINSAGSWKIVSATLGGAPIPSMVGNLLSFDFMRGCVYSDGTHRSTGKFKADRSSATFQISGIPIGDANRANDAVQGVYRASGDTLTLDGRQGDRIVLLVLRRREWGPLLPDWMPR